MWHLNGHSGTATERGRTIDSRLATFAPRPFQEVPHRSATSDLKKATHTTTISLHPLVNVYYRTISVEVAPRNSGISHAIRVGWNVIELLSANEEYNLNGLDKRFWLRCQQSQRSGATAKVDQVCDQLIANIDAWGNAAPTKPVDNGQAGSSDKDGKINEAQMSTSFTWASERLNNAGAGSSVCMEQSGPSSDAQRVWDDIVVPEMKSIGQQLQAVGKDAIALFRQGGEIAASQLIQVGKGALKAGVSSVKKTIKSLLELIASFLEKFKTLGNKAINIPIFTWLYKQISGGHDLTLFDAVSLVVAVPTTIFAKLITGKKPPSIPNLDAPLLGKILDDDKTVAEQVKTDFSILKVEVLVGITLTTGVFAVLKLIYKSFTGGHQGAMDELNSPEGLFDVFGIAIDVIACIVALPDNDDLPGADLRRWISYVSCARGIYHIIFYFVPSNEGADAAVLCLALITLLVNLGLNIALFVEEKYTGSKWKDYDEETSEQTVVTNALNAVAGISYFTASMFKKSQPEVSAIGAAIMTGTVAGAAVLEGVIFKHQYNLKKRVAISSTPPF